MGKRLELTGQRFGRLIVLKETARRTKRGSILWECLCDCGKRKIISGGTLVYGSTKSCGCGRGKHGDWKAKLYSVWANMKHRCLCPTAQAYAHYGERGISMCDEWIKDYVVFKKWALANGYKEGLQIDRRNNDKGYYPGNCRWTTGMINSQNQRSTKLNMQKAREIRIKYKTGNFTQKQIARGYDVSRRAIGSVINNQSWKESL